MTTADPPARLHPMKPLWIAWGRSGVEYHRITQPAQDLGHPAVTYHDGCYQDAYPGSPVEVATAPDVVIHQNAFTKSHQRLLGELPCSSRLIANVDDWIPGIPDVPDHSYHSNFNKQAINRWWAILRRSRQVLASTPWLVNRLTNEGFEALYTPNYLDEKRYPKPDWYRLESPVIRIGWAGASGHQQSLEEIAPAIETLLGEHTHLEYHHFGETPPFEHTRVVHHPWSERVLHTSNYNQNVDIVLTPIGDTDYHKAKSQLRLYEAAMLGKCVVGNRHHYHESPYTLHAVNSEDYYAVLTELVEDPERIEMHQFNQHGWARDNLTWKARGEWWETTMKELER